MTVQAGAGRRRTPLISRIVFALLVLATVLAFFISPAPEGDDAVHLRRQRAAPTAINPVDGPVGCRSTTVSFYILHHVDNVDVFVVNQSGATVRTVASGVPMRKPQTPTAQGFAAVTKTFTWAGSDNAGQPRGGGDLFLPRAPGPPGPLDPDPAGCEGHTLDRVRREGVAPPEVSGRTPR